MFVVKLCSCRGLNYFNGGFFCVFLLMHWQEPKSVNLKVYLLGNGWYSQYSQEKNDYFSMVKGFVVFVVSFTIHDQKESVASSILPTVPLSPLTVSAVSSIYMLFLERRSFGDSLTMGPGRGSKRFLQDYNSPIPQKLAKIARHSTDGV